MFNISGSIKRGRTVIRDSAKWAKVIQKEEGDVLLRYWNGEEKPFKASGFQGTNGLELEKRIKKTSVEAVIVPDRRRRKTRVEGKELPRTEQILFGED
jgi:hypothetical protein